ncbi:hypothetical protein NB311A_18888 [Nitrobacter sp. Nb-311A]|nr:hypothetical protein NB311A_18888 [Nitrobacter sp. Nb-311A]
MAELHEAETRIPRGASLTRDGSKSSEKSRLLLGFESSRRSQGEFIKLALIKNIKNNQTVAGIV